MAWCRQADANVLRARYRFASANSALEGQPTGCPFALAGAAAWRLPLAFLCGEHSHRYGCQANRDMLDLGKPSSNYQTKAGDEET
jgi:hypothetical protein